VLSTHCRKLFRRATVVALMTALSFVLMPVPSASAAETWGTLTFNKNPADSSNSSLRLEIWKNRYPGIDSAMLVASRTMRAGSGNGSTNDCASNAGWLPNGTYSMKMYSNYPGTVIKGYAFYLPNKVCSAGTVTRTELFIHTETGANNVQCADAAGDQACRWEYPAYNDYRSAACIKLAPGDVKYLHDTIKTYFGTSSAGGAVPFSLKVVS
jgi:hypothetical protein